MTNDVTVFGGKVNVADVRTLAQKAQAAALNNPRGGAPGGSVYMNFSGKRGIYTVGQDNRQVSPDETWIVDVTSFEEGWICWKGGRPASTRLSNIYTGVPIQAPTDDELGPFDEKKGEGWFQAKAFVLKSLDNDEQAYIKLNSISGVSAIAEQLIGPFSERAGAGEACWPVVALETEKFESQGFTNFKPKFEVLGWLTTEELNAVAAGEDVATFIEMPEEAPPPPPPASAGRSRRRP